MKLKAIITDIFEAVHTQVVLKIKKWHGLIGNRNCGNCLETKLNQQAFGDPSVKFLIINLSGQVAEYKVQVQVLASPCEWLLLICQIVSMMF